MPDPVDIAEHLGYIRGKIERVESDTTEIKAMVKDNEIRLRDLEQSKHRFLGWLVGIGTIGGGVGAALSKVFQW